MYMKVFAYQRRFDLENRNYEMIWIEVTLSTQRLFIGTYYRSSSDTLNETVDGYYETLSNTYSQSKAAFPSCVVIIQGDLNSPNTIWLPDSTTQTNYAGNRLLQLVNYFSLTQLVTSATYLTDQSQSQLDVFITDAPGYCIGCDVQPQISKCHHLPVLATLNFRISDNLPYKREIYDFDSADWVDLNYGIRHTDFDQCYTLEHPDEVINRGNEFCLSLSATIYLA